jgi:hypothetical protein
MRYAAFCILQDPFFTHIISLRSGDKLEGGDKHSDAGDRRGVSILLVPLLETSHCTILNIYLLERKNVATRDHFFALFTAALATFNTVASPD